MAALPEEGARPAAAVIGSERLARLDREGALALVDLHDPSVRLPADFIAFLPELRRPVAGDTYRVLRRSLLKASGIPERPAPGCDDWSRVQVQVDGLWRDLPTGFPTGPATANIAETVSRVVGEDGREVEMRVRMPRREASPPPAPEGDARPPER